MEGSQQPPTGWQLHPTPPQPQQQHWPPPAPRPYIDPSRLRPSAGWYAATVVPLILGFGLMALFIVQAVHAFPDKPRSFLAPGGPTLRLKDGDERTIWRHTRGAGRFESSGLAPQCNVVEPGGGLVRVKDAGSLTLTFSDDKFVAESEFRAPRDGTYRVRCLPASGGSVQALGISKKPHFGRFVAMILAAIGSAFLAIAGAGVVIAVVAVGRHRHKRRLQDEEMAAQAGTSPA